MGALVGGTGVVYAERLAPTAANWMTPGYVDGRKKVNLDFYVGLGTEAAGSTLYMGALIPQGAKVISVKVHTSAATNNLTMSVGDCQLTTRYASADTGPAAKGVSTYTGMIDSTNGFYLIGTNTTSGASLPAGGDSQILLTTAGATLGAGTIYGVEVEYTTD